MKFTTHGLQMAGLELVPPFQVDVSLDPDEDLTDQPTESLTFQTVARVLPGRRLSGVAEYQGKSDIHLERRNQFQACHLQPVGGEFHCLPCPAFPTQLKLLGSILFFVLCCAASARG